MDDIDIDLASPDSSDSKRKREFKRLIRRQAKKRKLMQEEIVRLPRQSNASSMLWTHRSIPSLKESVWRNPNITSAGSPTTLLDIAESTNDTSACSVVQDGLFNMKSVLEGYSLMTGALSAVFNSPAANRPPGEPRLIGEPVITSALIEQLAVDYLKVVIQNLNKPNSVIPKELKTKFLLTLDTTVDTYLRPANLVNAGSLMDSKSVSAWLSEIISEIRLWRELQSVTEKEVSERVMVSTWIPGPCEDHEILFKRIKLQNPDLHTELWRLYHAVHTKTDDRHGQWLVLGIDQMSRKMLVLCACRAKCGSEEIRFEVPPFARDSTESDSSESDYPISRDSDEDAL